MTPREYAIKHGLAANEAAYRLCVSEQLFKRYTFSTKNRVEPSKQTQRIAQLLDFIEEQGLTPPMPKNFT